MVATISVKDHMLLVILIYFSNNEYNLLCQNCFYRNDVLKRRGDERICTLEFRKLLMISSLELLY